MYTEDNLIPISAIQHYVFCERRAALVFLERLWNDNLATTEGSRLHRKTESGKSEWQDGVLVTRSLPVHSLQNGLIGVMDVVEFHPCDSNSSESQTVELAGRKGTWVPFPIEFKRGKLRREEGFIQQLCAQTLCLEEMLDTHIEEGAIFYGKTRRRFSVIFDQDLRERTRETVTKLHHLFEQQITPVVKEQAKCSHCSLYDLCSPQSLKSSRSIKLYFNKILQMDDTL